VLPDYERALKLHPDNRGYLYLLGEGVVCKQCLGKSDDQERCACKEVSREPLQAFERAGFTLEVTELAHVDP
jgi:hypothetical protein